MSYLLSVLWIQSTENNSVDWIMSPEKESGEEEIGQISETVKMLRILNKKYEK